jgi:hypothetical protein
MRKRSSMAILSCLCLLFISETGLARMKPSEGPPWLTSYDQARRKAIREGKPIFVYFTKHT